jgi:GNAT superfamily N-acetyltransferase
VRHWFATAVVPTRGTWLAEVDGAAVAVLVLFGDELDQLYVDPGWQGRGIGSDLVRLAQQRRPGGLALWTFQSNLGARRFYERHGSSRLAGRTGLPTRSANRTCGTSGVATRLGCFGPAR